MAAAHEDDESHDTGVCSRLSGTLISFVAAPFSALMVLGEKRTLQGPGALSSEICAAISVYFAYQLVGILAGHLLDLCWFYVVLQVKSADVPFSEVSKRLLGNSQMDGPGYKPACN